MSTHLCVQVASGVSAGVRCARDVIGSRVTGAVVDSITWHEVERVRDCAVAQGAAAHWYHVSVLHTVTS